MEYVWQTLNLVFFPSIFVAIFCFFWYQYLFMSPQPTRPGREFELEESLQETIPLGRVEAPEDGADAVMFLCSHQARWITGQVAGGHAL